MICKCGHEIGENAGKIMHLRTPRGLKLFTMSCQAEGCECMTPKPKEEIKGCRSCKSFCNDPITWDSIGED